MKMWLSWCCTAGLLACSGADDGGGRETAGFDFGTPPRGGTSTGGAAGTGGLTFQGGGMLAGGGAANGSGGGTTPPPGGIEPGCSSAEIVPMVKRSPGNLLVLFDRSSSMMMPFGTPDANGVTRSRFDAVNDALQNGLGAFTCPPAVVDGPACDETLTVGSILFPSVPSVPFIDGLCPEVDPIDATTQISWKTVSPFLEAWRAYWTPGSGNVLMDGTPIERAFARGDEAIVASALPGKMAVLFLTDGESYCAPGTTPLDAIMQSQAWAAQDIKTYVVSVAEQAAAFNDQVAQAGGSGQAINPSDAQQLNAAISDIVLQAVEIVDCKTTIEGQQITNIQGACDRGQVFLSTAQVPCDPVNGFQVISPTEIELFGTACETLKGGSRLTAQFPCDVLLE